MKYLVTNEQDGQGKSIISDVEELTLIDPACGSGHILVEGFDLYIRCTKRNSILQRKQ